MALLPVMGTVLILASDSSSLINRFLTQRVLVYIGLISYPLYLWHWPLLSFAKIIVAEDLNLVIKFSLLALGFILASLTYQLFETPIRKQAASNSLAITLSTAVGFIAVLGGIVLQQKGLPARHAFIEGMRASQEPFRANKDTETGKVCRGRIIEVDECAISNPDSPPTIALIGDSHAGHLFPGLKSILDERKENLVLLAQNGTSPLINVVSKRSPDTTLDHAFNLVLKSPSIHTVILSSFWGNYYEEAGIELPDGMYKMVIQDITETKETNQANIFAKAFQRTVETLQAAKKQVIIFYDIPTLPFRLDMCLPRPIVGAKRKCTFSAELDRTKQQGYRKTLDSVLRKLSPVQVYDPVPFFCRDNECSVYRDSIILYTNEHHFSAAGSLAFVKQLVLKSN
ncbi:MAG: acyltransferase family protein [Bdellovibrionia bacterium]